MIVYSGVTVLTKEAFVSRLKEVENVGDGVHVDIMDGVYVPNTLLSLDSIGGVPEEKFFEAHLMVNNPFQYFELCQKNGYKKVIVHFDSLALDTYSEVLLIQDKIHSLNMQFCLAFGPKQPFNLHDDLCKFDQVLIMTVNPGFSGQAFIHDQLTEIKRLRAFCPDLPIEVDGNITDATAPLVVHAGATHAVSTSYLSGTDIISRAEILKNIGN